MESIRQTPVETPAGTYAVHWFWDETAPAEPPYDHACGLLKKGGPRTIDIREDCGGQIGCGRGPDAAPDWAGLAGRQAALRSVWAALACRRHPAWDPTDAVSGAALVRYLTLKGFAGVTVIDDDPRRRGQRRPCRARSRRRLGVGGLHRPGQRRRGLARRLAGLA